ncbi:MAG TPA: hypothetical protein DHN29_18150 [Cytophagales bacterium]|nr:hypothetical protein [Cytophagales bacterium]
MIKSADLTAFKPSISISNKASISPENGVELDFTNNVIYTVTAQDGLEQEWIVSVENAIEASTEADILTFDVGADQSVGNIDTVNHLIEIVQFEDKVVLTPIISTSRGASVSPASGASISFVASDTVLFTVTAEDAITQQTWKVYRSEPINPFVTVWQLSEESNIRLNLDGDFDYNFGYLWTNNGEPVTSGWHTTDDGDFVTSLPAGENTLSIVGEFPHFLIPSSSMDDLTDVSQWGDIEWKSMEESFEYYDGETFSATDLPDLSEVASMAEMFSYAYEFNGDLSDWDVSNVTDMSEMFEGAESFNGDLSSWDVSSVTNMSYMFSGDEDDMYFDRDISSWNVSNVTDFSGMFSYNVAFNQDLSGWDVSSATDMSSMFSGTIFNGDISSWDVSNVTDMSYMFSSSQFSGDITGWDISSVTSFAGFLYYAQSFISDLSVWDFSNVTDMSYMLAFASYNHDISGWNVSNVINFNGMFYYNQVYTGNSMSSWDVSSAITMSYMFYGSSFNGDISNWDVSNVANMRSMFAFNEVFNGDLSGWDVSSVTEMDDMFYNAYSFNNNISDWDVSNVIDMNDMFHQAVSFNQDLSNWNVTSLLAGTFNGGHRMFNYSGLSQENYDKILIGWLALDSLNSNVRLGAAGLTFCVGAAARDTLKSDYGWVFEGDVADCAQGTDIFSFELAEETEPAFIDSTAHTIELEVAFGTDLTSLSPTITVSKGAAITPESQEAIDFTSPVIYTVTAADTSITQEWTVTVIANDGAANTKTDFRTFTIGNQIGEAEIDTTNHTVKISGYNTGDLDVTALVPTFKLSHGATCSPASGEAVDFTGSDSAPIIYTVTAEDGVTQQEWSLSLEVIDAFVVLTEVGANSSFGIPLNPAFSYDFAYSWQKVDDEAIAGNGQHQSGALSIEVPEPGTYQVSIAGEFPHIFKSFFIEDVLQWGDVKWQSMESSFKDWDGTGFSATDAPDLSEVTNMSQMFYNAASFNSDLSNWDVSNVEYMSYMFQYASLFNQPLNEWDVSSVVIMYSMFQGARSFNQDLSSWETSSVTDMSYMFYSAYLFNGEINGWDVSSVLEMEYMFAYDTSFNQPLDAWDVSAVQDISSMFTSAFAFNQPLNTWDVSSVTEMDYMFSYARAFNQDLNSWNTENVVRIYDMFADATSFNGDISTWNLSSVNNMNEMFSNATSFAGDISQWDVSAVVYFYDMFEGATSFNSDLSSWNVSSAQDMDDMFRGASSFNQNLSSWDVSKVTDMGRMFDDSGLSDDNYDLTLIGWASQGGLKSNVSLGASGINYCQGAEARALLMGTYGWNISDEGQLCSDEASLLTFAIPNQERINRNDTNQTIDIIMPFGTDLTGLTPNLTISEEATVSPAIGESIDFSSNITYTITAEDGESIEEWLVTVVAADPKTGTDILTFEIPNQQSIEILSETNEVNVTMPFGTDLTELTPVFTLSEDATSSPESGVISDFTNPVTYTVTAQDGSTQDWVVSVTVASLNTDLQSFVLDSQTGSAIIDSEVHTVTIEVVFGTDVTSLIPEITVLEDVTFSPESGSSVDFSNPVTYTVTGQDGTTTQDWLVTVNVAPNTATDIITFELSEQTGEAIIDEENHEVEIEVAFGTDLSVLTPSFSLSEGATSSPASGTTMSFAEPAILTVTAQDESSTQSWTVTVTVAPNSENDILTFDLSEQIEPAIIDSENHTVSVIVSEETSLFALVPVFTLSEDATSNPESGVAVDFTDPVTYTITAASGTSQQVWLVTVENEVILSSENDIITFELANQVSDAVIDTVSHAIGVVMTEGSDFTNLAPVFTLSEGATSDPESGEVIDFTLLENMTVTYLVTAEDGTTQAWLVTVEEDAAELNSSTDILSFIIAEQVESATINTENHTVSVIVAEGTDLSSLVPSIILSEGASSDPTSGEIVDFTISDNNTVTYLVTAEDGTTQTWVVTVEEEAAVPDSSTDILGFVIAEQVESASINTENHTITVVVSEGTDLTAIAPSITLSEGATSNPASGEEVDFSSSADSPVAYTVTAEDQETQQVWLVTVTEESSELNSEADILAFELPEQTGVAIIDESSQTVSIEVAFGTDVSSLVPTLTLSVGASSNPENGATVDFTDPVTYAITAEDGEINRNWIVTVTVEELSSSTDFLSFALPGRRLQITMDPVEKEIFIEVSAETDITQLAPLVELAEGATSNPASGEVVDFTNPVIYTITAEDGITSEEWLVTVTKEAILGFEEALEVSIYPNPTNQFVNIISEKVLTVSLHDLSGQEVLNSQKGKELTFDLQELPKGMYLLVVREGDQITVQKILKSN